MAHNAASDTLKLVNKDLEMQKLKKEIIEDAKREIRKEFADEQIAFIREQREILTRLNSAAKEAEQCAIQYQNNLDSFLRS